MQIGVDQQGGLNGAWKLAVREELGMSLDCAPSSLSLSLSSSLSHSLSHCPPILVTLSSLSHCHPCHTPCRSPCHTCSRTLCHKSSLSHCFSCHITCHIICHSACQIVLFVPHASFPNQDSPLNLLPCTRCIYNLVCLIASFEKKRKDLFHNKNWHLQILQCGLTTLARHKRKSLQLFWPLYMPLLLHGKAFIGCHMCLKAILLKCPFLSTEGGKSGCLGQRGSLPLLLFFVHLICGCCSWWYWWWWWRG